MLHHALVATTCNEEPVGHKDAFSNDLWMQAMQAKLDSIHANDTWEICNLPPGKCALGIKWVYKVKHKDDSSIDRYKAHLVVLRRVMLSKKALILRTPLAPLLTFLPSCVLLPWYDGRCINLI